MPTLATRSGMHVQKTEDLGFRVAEGVEHRAGCQVARLREVDHHLRAHCPFIPFESLGRPELSSSFRPTGPTGHRRPRSAPRECPCPARRSDRRAARPATLSPSTSASETGIEGQICTAPVIINCSPTHCIELPDRQHQSALLVQELGGPRQFERIVVGAARTAGSACPRPSSIACAGSRRADREGTATFSSVTAAAIGICDGSRFGKAGPYAARLGHHAGHAEAKPSARS